MMNNTNNDSKIMTLKTQIINKRKQFDGVKKFSPITNCSIEVDGIRSNIQVLSKEQLISLLVKLNSYKNSANDLGLLEEYNISDYKIGEWIADIKSKLNIVSRKDERLKLKSMEDKLDELLSSDKKTELEINEIEALLK